MSLMVVERARTEIFDIAVTSAGLPLPITGMGITFGVKKRLDDGVVLISKSIGSGVTVIDAAGGLATLELTPADTNAPAFPNAKLSGYEFDLKLIDGTREWRIDSGKFLVTGNVI